MSDKTTVVFMGTPEFSCSFLRKLANNTDFAVLGVITQEDKPVGRKKILTPPPVKNTALKLGIPIYQPSRLNKDIELINILKEMHPDFLVVVAYGQIISKEILDIPQIAPINVHGSILPKYRGASPIQESLFNGDRKTGLSIMEMDVGMDTGDVYKVLPQEISPNDTDISLRDKLSNLGSEELPPILLDIQKGKLKKVKQDSSKATNCHKIDKKDGFIDPSKLTSEEIYNRWRAFIIWPGIFMPFNNKKMKLLDINICEDIKLDPGKFAINKKQIFLGCKTGTIEIKQLQTEGKSITSASNFLAGNRHLFE